ncbi:MAG: fibrobacter succinogenes major paralogous domain-containing protein, partial [Bacteroidia bacterium]|nr:fibrobacter succinogenes major paralogous domain-containing protein [Bacteroidia bacterium]
MKKQSLLPVLLIVSLGGLFGQSVDNTSTGTMVDARDGHRYKWVRIGMQTWMEENLAWLPSVSKHETGSETQSHYYVYGYEGTSVKEAKSNSNYKTYGVLYNWEAAKKACPSGWHLPTDLEWKTLEKYTGMSESDADAKGWRYSGAVGGKLKESESSHWSNPNIGANNRSGFTALPGEFRNDKEDSNSLGGWAAFWSASRDGMSGAWTRWLSDDLDAVSRHCDSLDYGFSVRCLQTKSSTSTVLIPDTIVKPSDPARINAQDNQSILKKMNQRIAEVDLLYAKTNVSEERAKLMKEKAELLYEKSATDRNFLFQAIE